MNSLLSMLILRITGRVARSVGFERSVRRKIDILSRPLNEFRPRGFTAHVRFSR